MASITTHMVLALACVFLASNPVSASWAECKTTKMVLKNSWMNNNLEVLAYSRLSAGQSVADCLAKCRANQECYSFNYNKLTKWCYLGTTEEIMLRQTRNSKWAAGYRKCVEQITSNPWNNDEEFGGLPFSPPSTPPPPPNPPPPAALVSGLVGWYDGASWTGTQWTDKSGTGNHATQVQGTISTTSTLNGLTVLSGDTTAGIRFPAAILPTTYTLFHVARYTGATRLRIFDGVDRNWLSGFLDGLAGVAYHGNWVTQFAVDLHGTNWVVSSDQNNLYRSNFIDRTIGNGILPSNAQLSVNWGGVFAGTKSDWACAEVIVYSRTLSLAEITDVEQYLKNRYNL